LAGFTQNTPPPGSTDGGLLNAIVGSVIMTVIASVSGAPLGPVRRHYRRIRRTTGLPR